MPRGRGGRAGQAAQAGRGRDVVAGPFPYAGRRQGNEPDAPAALPPAPAMNPLVTEVGMVLFNLGFPAAIMQYFTTEGVTLLRHFLILHKEGIDKIFARMDTAQVLYTAIQYSLIKSLHYYERRMYAISIPINPIAITLELLASDSQTIQEVKSSSTTNNPTLLFLLHLKIIPSGVLLKICS
jgi:hypothetical protein